MRVKIGFLLSLIQFLRIADCSGYFSVYAPRIIRPNSDYNVAVSSYEDKHITLSLGLGPNLNLKEVVALDPFSSKIVHFNIPEISKSSYVLSVEDTSKKNSKKTYDLTYEPDYYSVLIQTDKAAYKPGDLVRFRIIVLDRNTRPMKTLKPINLLISDPRNTSVDFVENIQFNTGVYTSEYQLSEEPIIGNWTISAYEKSLKVKYKTFEVAEFVLPTFSVDVVTPEDILIDSEKGAFWIESKYTFGKPVVGRATLILKAEDSIIFEKTVEIIGLALFDLNLITDLGLTSETELDVTAIVEEKFTGIKQSKTLMVKVHSELYLIEDPVYLSNTFHPGKNIDITVPIKTFEGSPVTDNKNKVYLHAESDSGETKTYEEYAVRGFAKFKVNLPDAISYDIKASYLQVEKELGTLNKFNNVNGFSLENTNHEAHKVGENIELRVSSKEPLYYLNYVVSTRGSVVKSEVIKFSGKDSLYEFNIPVIFEMVPSCKVLISTVQGGSLRTAEVVVNIENVYNNKIELHAESKVEPKDDIDIKVRTESGSYVGLLAVDQKTLLFKKGNDLSSTEINKNLQVFESDIIILTNAEYTNTYYSQGDNVDDVDLGETTEIREHFPETWIWLDIPTAKEETSIQQKLPDSITSWILTGFALHPEKGLAYTDGETKITAFKKLFVNFELPYSVKLGEVLSIDVLVFNYESSITLNAEVLLRKNNQEFEFVNSDDEDDDPDRKFVTVDKNLPGSVTFKIRPKKVGLIPLMIELRTDNGGDTVRKLLRVEPSGLTKYVNKDIYIKLSPDNPNFKKTFELDIPENIVPNSNFAKVSVVGSIMGPTIKNLNNLIREPSGCGEQLMINFVPNILVYRYLEATKQLSTEIKNKVTNNLKLGYSRFNNYHHTDGSYSVFQADCCGSTWLSAYIARSMEQARKLIYVDSDRINQVYKFLVDLQQSNGEFKENGRVHHKEYSLLFEQGNVALTSFVLTSFLENSETASKYKSVVDKGVQYIANNIDNIDDTFSQAISAYVLKLAGHEKAHDVLAKLKIKAKKNNNKIWWQKSQNSESTHDVEITGYVLMALSETELTKETLPIVNWLISKRNNNGGFDSTQDTVVGLSALTKFTEQMYTDMGISVSALSQTYNFYVNESNSLILQSHDLGSGVKTVDVEVAPKSKGACLLQISYQYNIDETENQIDFNLNVFAKFVTKEVINVKVCTSKPEGESNMAYIEVQLPSGFTAQKKISTNDIIRKVEYKNKDNVITIYLDSIKGEEICLNIEATRTFVVDDSKKAYVIVKDFYDTTKQTKKSYEINN